MEARKISLANFCWTFSLLFVANPRCAVCKLNSLSLSALCDLQHRRPENFFAIRRPLSDMGKQKRERERGKMSARPAMIKVLKPVKKNSKKAANGSKPEARSTSKECIWRVRWPSLNRILILLFCNTPHESAFGDRERRWQNCFPNSLAGSRKGTKLFHTGRSRVRAMRRKEKFLLWPSSHASCLRGASPATFIKFSTV